MSEAVIQVRGLGKKYRLSGERKRYKTFRESLTGMAMAPLRRLANPAQTSGTDSRAFWALKDVSFNVNAGDVVGIIGRNGAGKSTLLKVLSRITDPTEGEVEIEGRVGSLLEVGTGFHPELTGRENIYLNGAILGMKHVEIRRKFDEIVAFAETEKFLDTPVKHYSSGMYTRLAFSVAAHLEPEILVVDEVLAVGDAAFQEKCIGKMKGVSASGRTVLFVSHNMAAVRSLCSTGIMMNKGQLVHMGDVEQVISQYLRPNTEVQEIRFNSRVAGLGLRAVYLVDRETGARVDALLFGRDYDLIIEIEPPAESLRAAFVVGVFDAGGEKVSSLNSVEEGIPFFDAKNTAGIRYRLTQVPLFPGNYRVSVNVADQHTIYLESEFAAEFSIDAQILPGAAWAYSRTHGVFRLASGAELLPG